LDVVDVSDQSQDYTSNLPVSDDPANGDWAYNSSLSLNEGPAVYASDSVDSALEVYYGYRDADGDGESGTAFQWYRCDTADDAGTPIDGETEKTYTPK
jgi:hypothetical protein